jgi:hypothetical protein
VKYEEEKHLEGSCRGTIKSEHYIDFYLEILRNIPNILAAVQAKNKAYVSPTQVSKVAVRPTCSVCLYIL